MGIALRDDRRLATFLAATFSSSLLSALLSLVCGGGGGKGFFPVKAAAVAMAVPACRAKPMSGTRELLTYKNNIYDKKKREIAHTASKALRGLTSYLVFVFSFYFYFLFRFFLGG